MINPGATFKQARPRILFVTTDNPEGKKFRHVYSHADVSDVATPQ
jgi:hypothetical protein